jgi:hypothetical protein
MIPRVRRVQGPDLRYETESGTRLFTRVDHPYDDLTLIM